MFKATLDQAIEAIRENIDVFESSRVLGLMAARNKVIAEDIKAINSVPRFNKSPLDGFAIRSCDLEDPTAFKVIDVVMAGETTNKKIKKKTAIRVMTGAKIPEGADTVVRLEDTVEDGKTFTTEVKQKPFENYIQEGDSIKYGDLLIKKGKRLNGFDISSLAEVGIKEVECYRELSFGILTSGDELIPLTRNLVDGKIFNTNQLLLKSRLEELYFTKIYSKHVSDNKELLKTHLLDLIHRSNFVITTGGVSVGDKDLMSDVIEELKGKYIFNKVQIKPGSHACLSIIDGIPVLSLSGNPFAAYVGFEIFAREVIMALMGTRDLELLKMEGITTNTFPKSSKMTRIVRARYEAGKITFPQDHSNGTISSMARCNCLVYIEAGSGPVEEGSKVTAYLV